MSAATLRREQRMFVRHHVLVDHYRPRRACSARITLFRARSHADPLGWQRYASHPLESREFDIRGTERLSDPHLAMRQDENVDLYAAHSGSCWRSSDGAPAQWGKPSPW